MEKDLTPDKKRKKNGKHHNKSVRRFGFYRLPKNKEERN